MGKKFYIKDGKKVYLSDSLKKEEILDEDDEVPKNGKDDDDEEADIDEAATKAAKEIMSQVSLNDDRVSELTKTVQQLVDKDRKTDSKLSNILNGKDYVKDADSLTKEEKIVGFYHALITNNTHALKALSGGVAADGGNLLPQDFMNELNRNLADIVVFRQIARVVPMKRNTMVIPRVTSSVNTYWTAENAAKTTTTAAFTQDTLTAFKLAAILYASDELVEDSRDSGSFDIVQLIIQLFAESIAENEETAFATGNGTTQPLGLETARAAGTFASVASSGQNFDDVITLIHSLAPQYRANAVFVANDITIRNMRLIKDTQGRYMWNEAISAGGPATFYGYRVYTSNALPGNVLYFGDFKRGFWIGDRGGMSVKVTQESETAFTKDQTAIRVVQRVGSQVVLPAALKALTGF